MKFGKSHDKLSNPKLSLLAGAGLGATLMYFFDSLGGGRRRALLRDKSIKAKRKTRETVEGRARDVRNRAKGVVSETRSALDGEKKSRNQNRANMALN